MAGHSKWANIKHRKGAQDAKRAKLFNKIARVIEAAVRVGGADPNFNPRLRLAITEARAVNMPRDRIDTAIKKGSGTLGDNKEYVEVRYEGYAPGGIALIIEALTDNRNRTAPDIRAIFSKYGGALGETGSVSFMFDQVGLIQYPLDKATPEAMFEAALDAGAGECDATETHHEITCAIDDLNAVREALQQKLGDAETARLSWKPKNLVEVTGLEQAEKLVKMIEALEDNDDVQFVFGNYDIPDEIAEKLAS